MAPPHEVMNKLIGNDNITWHMQRHSTRHAVRHRNSRKRAEYTDGIAALNEFIN